MARRYSFNATPFIHSPHIMEVLEEGPNTLTFNGSKCVETLPATRVLRIDQKYWLIRIVEREVLADTSKPWFDKELGEYTCVFPTAIMWIRWEVLCDLDPELGAVKSVDLIPFVGVQNRRQE